MKTILVFGASGFVGGCLVRAALAEGWQVVAVTHTPAVGDPRVTTLPCDITAAGQVERLLAGARPEAVANLAASANIDRAEIDRETAYRVNAVGPENIARSCNHAGIRLVHFTTDAVFDGTQAAYTENDSPHPLNYYGYTKAAGDSAVLREDPQAALLRVSLILGFPVSQGNSFLAMLKDRLVHGIEVFTPIEEIRTPVDIHTLCAAALETASNHHAGFLNIGCTKSIDRHSLTTRLAREMGYDSTLIRPTGTSQPGRAPRHRNGILDVSLAQKILSTPMPNLEETIARAVL